MDELGNQEARKAILPESLASQSPIADSHWRTGNRKSAIGNP
jgi:hypothetical protein